MPVQHNDLNLQQSQRPLPHAQIPAGNQLTPHSAVTVVQPNDHRRAPSVSLSDHSVSSPPDPGRDINVLPGNYDPTSSGSASSDDVALAGTSSISLIDTSGSHGLKRRGSNRSASSFNAATGGARDLTDAELGLSMSANASGLNWVASPTLPKAPQNRAGLSSIHARERSTDSGQLKLTAETPGGAQSTRVLSSADVYGRTQNKQYHVSNDALSENDPRAAWQSAGAYSMYRIPSSDSGNPEAYPGMSDHLDDRRRNLSYRGSEAPGNDAPVNVLGRAKTQLRRLSARVINVRHQRSDSFEPQIRLLDGESEDDSEASDDETLRDGNLAGDPSADDKRYLREQSPRSDRQDDALRHSARHAEVSVETCYEALRGKTLSYFDRHSRIRRAALAVLVWPWTEPAILVLIVLNIVILTIQSAPNAYTHAVYRGSGYFHAWEDYVLFAIFVLFTLETGCRILVSGLLFDPVDIGPQTPSNLRPGGSRWWLRRMWRGAVDKAGYILRGRTSTTVTARQSDDASLRSRLETANTSTVSMKRIDSPEMNGLRNAKTASIADRHDTKEIGFNGANGLSTPLYPPRSLKTTPQAKSTAAFEMGTATQYGDIPFMQTVNSQRQSHASHRRAYLRNSWNRLDLLAVASFWISFALAMSGTEGRKHIYVFRALSTLRAARLLTVTVGTSTILRSLKQSAPMMVNVAFFVVFAMLLFSIIGVQSFEGSFKRTCLWSDGIGNVTTNQFCGGHIDAQTLQPVPFIDTDGSQLPVRPKGFICPLAQICLEQNNPYNNTQSFDNALASLLQVVVIMSSNTWTGLMYSMIDAEYFVSSLFFVVCLILLNIWLVNIFVAVIINTFGNIREETKHSAFAASHSLSQDVSTTRIAQRSQGGKIWRTALLVNKYFWIAMVTADVGIQASKTARDTAARVRLLNDLELYFTLAFLVEMCLRFMLHLPDWRSFVNSSANIADLSLAAITCVIQIPAIRQSAVYPWMTVFQLMRFYRVIVAVPRMRALLAKMTSSTAGLLNMLVFLLLMNILAAIISVQFLRGDIVDEDVQWSFAQIYNAFLSIYVIFSSENWTTPLYDAMAAEVQFNQAIITAVFLAGWFLFANFILLQMFIAVINEGFATAEADKLKAQADVYAKRDEVDKPTVNWISRISPYRSRAKSIASVAQGISVVANPALAYTRLGDQTLRSGRLVGAVTAARNTEGNDGSIIASIKHIVRKKRERRGTRQQMQSTDEEESMVDVDKNLDLLVFAGPSRQNTLKDEALLQDQRRTDHEEVLARHPRYDHALWIIPQSNKLRQFCQRVTEPAHGQRLSGRKPYRTWTIAFKLLILAAIVSSVTIAAIATPVYRRNYYVQYRHIGLTWFNAAESALGFIFVIEFLVKIIADGFAFTPNAYLLSVWNLLDLFVLATLIVDISTALSTSNASVNRFIRSLKAFRALRLINLSATMRNSFYDVMIVGASRILDASVLTILYIIPFSIWGQNLFSGLLYSCNDSSVLTKAECVGEYWVSPAGWRFLVPRVWQNPQTWSFDNFRSAFLILFEIVSLEGWTSVMASGMAIVGRDQQSQKDAAQYNSIFFVVYNLIGAIVVLTLFVSIIIENFSIRSGMALLTTDQRQWLDLKKLLTRQRPAKQPATRPSDALSAWCHERATAKHGWWSRCMTGLYLIHIAILLSQTAAQPDWTYTLRDWMFILLTLVYAVDIAVRLTGLGWRNFSQNGWNLYDIFVVAGTFATTIPILLGTSSQTAIQLQKLFLVSIAFKLVQKNNSLNQLFKTAAASLPAILSIFGLWLTLFLVWAILFLENFSLTRWGNNETWRQNYSTFPQAMLMLTLMSSGENWNSFMHDYTLEVPYCSPSNSYLFTDCGSPTAAYALFITWNIISMYIFLNMLTGVVVENFSFVFSLHGRTITVDREDMRNFKRAWAKYDRRREGRIQRRDLMAFLKSLDGIFDVNVYTGPFLAQNLATDSDAVKILSDPAAQTDFLSRLYRQLDRIDFTDIRSRRRDLNRIYQDALLAEDSKGIPFTSMLLILAHYKLIDPHRSLQLQERYEWAAKTQIIDDLIGLDRVRSLIRTRYWRTRFLRLRRASHQQPDEKIQRKADLP